VALADGTRPRDFTQEEWQKSRSDEDLRLIILDGRGSMPSFGSFLPPDDAEALVRHVRGFGPSDGR
jgi:hypothetical protein